MKLKSRISIMLGITLVVFAVDHITKLIAFNSLRGTPPLTLLGGVIRILYSENGGGLLSLGTDWPSQVRFWVLTVAPGILLLIIPILIACRQMHFLEVTWLSFFLAGGFSNWIDRVLQQGNVVDFMNLGVGGLRSGIFNVADMAITGAVSLLLVIAFRGERPEPKPQTE